MNALQHCTTQRNTREHNEIQCNTCNIFVTMRCNPPRYNTPNTLYNDSPLLAIYCCPNPSPTSMQRTQTQHSTTQHTITPKDNTLRFPMMTIGLGRSLPCINTPHADTTHHNTTHHITMHHNTQQHNTSLHNRTIHCNTVRCNTVGPLDV